jgi:hypothetical protein
VEQFAQSHRSQKRWLWVQSRQCATEICCDLQTSQAKTETPVPDAQPWILSPDAWAATSGHFLESRCWFPQSSGGGFSTSSSQYRVTSGRRQCAGLAPVLAQRLLKAPGGKQLNVRVRAAARPGCSVLRSVILPWKEGQGECPQEPSRTSTRTTPRPGSQPGDREKRGALVARSGWGV